MSGPTGQGRGVVDPFLDPVMKIFLYMKNAYAWKNAYLVRELPMSSRLPWAVLD